MPKCAPAKHVVHCWCGFSGMSSYSVRLVILLVALPMATYIWAQVIAYSYASVKMMNCYIHAHALHGLRKNIASQNFTGCGIHCSLVCTCAISKWPWKVIWPKPNQPDHHADWLSLYNAVHKAYASSKAKLSIKIWMLHIVFLMQYRNIYIHTPASNL